MLLIFLACTAFAAEASPIRSDSAERNAFLREQERLNTVRQGLQGSNFIYNRAKLEEQRKVLELQKQLQKTSVILKTTTGSLQEKGDNLERIRAEDAKKAQLLAAKEKSLERVRAEAAQKEQLLVKKGESLERVRTEDAKKAQLLAAKEKSLERVRAEAAQKEQLLVKKGESLERVRTEDAKKAQLLVKKGESLERVRTEDAKKAQLLVEREKSLARTKEELRELSLQYSELLGAALKCETTSQLRGKFLEDIVLQLQKDGYEFRRGMRPEAVLKELQEQLKRIDSSDKIQLFCQAHGIQGQAVLFKTLRKAMAACTNLLESIQPQGSVEQEYDDVLDRTTQEIEGSHLQLSPTGVGSRGQSPNPTLNVNTPDSLAQAVVNEFSKKSPGKDGDVELDSFLNS